MDNYIYNDIIKHISQEFELELSRMEAVYNFDHGYEFEVAVCKILSRILPSKYGICRGFVIDHNGNEAGDDIIIYDKERFTTLRFLGQENNFALKNRIPVEAVYAYIEAKHTLTEDALTKAFDQIINVKEICYNRQHELDFRDELHLSPGQYHIFDNSYSKTHAWKPIIKTPVYTMILSKYGVDSQNNKTENYEGTKEFLIDKIINLPLKEKINNAGFYNPESIIAGDSVTAFCGHHLIDADGNEKGIEITRFNTGIQNKFCYQVNVHEKMAYGLAVAHLLLALDFIELLPMPWDRIFNTVKMPDKTLRERFYVELENNADNNA